MFTHNRFNGVRIFSTKHKRFLRKIFYSVRRYLIIAPETFDSRLPYRIDSGVKSENDTACQALKWIAEKPKRDVFFKNRNVFINT